MPGLTRNMSGLAVVLLTICPLLSACKAAPPEDPVGTWKLTCVCPDGKSRDCIITVSKEGCELKATYKADGATRAARSVAFEGGILSVEVDGKFAGSRYGLTYKGRPAGDTICGDVHWTYTWASGTFTFKGERIEEEDIAAR